MNEPELRHAILEDPQADAPRLAYAAWCAADGDPARADYIRAAVARARVDCHGPEAERLFKEEMRALQSRPKDRIWHAHFKAVDARYSATLGLERSAFYYDDIRGFMGTVGGRLPDIMAVLEELCAAEPIEKLDILWDAGRGVRDTPADAETLAAMPLLRQIRSMVVPAEPSLIRALRTSPFTGNVERLVVVKGENDKRVVDVEALIGELVVGEQGLTGVRRLEIKGIPIGPSRLERLCASGMANRLNRLAVERAGVGDAGAKVLAAATTLGQVEELWLRENAMTNEGLTALANATGLAAVRDLDVGKNTFDVSVMKALGERTSMKGLRRLGAEDAVQERVYAAWTDWTGANIGGDYEMRAMHILDLAAKHPLPGVEFFSLRHE